jgi:cytochrome b561
VIKCLEYYRKKLKKIPEEGKISHAHGSVGLTVKMAILLKAIYRFNATPSKFQHNSSQIMKGQFSASC